MCCQIVFLCGAAAAPAPPAALTPLLLPPAGIGLFKGSSESEGKLAAAPPALDRVCT